MLKAWEQPTPAQAEAGNYFKPTVYWLGLVIKVENPAGTVRVGRGWKTKMVYDYGYVRGTEAVDGDEVDVYLGPSLAFAPNVYIVHQRRYGDWGKYDEDKCMLGFLSEAQAKAAYLRHYDDPRFLGPITTMPVDEFVAKVQATKDKPAMIKAHIKGYTRADGTVVAPHEDRRQSLQDDLTRQEKWLHQRAQELGYRDIEHLLNDDYPVFERLAKEWRDRNPVEVALKSMVLFIKAIDRKDTQTLSLFDAPVVVSGHVRTDGTYVAPYVAKRKHAQHTGHIGVSNLIKIEPDNNSEPELEAVEEKPVEAPVEQWRRPNQRDVPDYLVERVKAIIEKANKRAKKLGVEGFKLIIGDSYEKKLTTKNADDVTRYQTMVPLTIEGPAIKAKGGWTLAGRVDFEGGSIIVNSRPGQELPPRYRSITPLCEHCNTDRQRNAVFVFNRDGGDYMQVGRQCLQDYMGRSPEDALWAASEFGGVFDEIDDEIERSGGREPMMVSLKEVMTAAAHVVRKTGFISRKVANDREIASTSDDVSHLLFDKQARKNYKPEPEDIAKAQAVIDWVQNEIAAKPDQSDYEYNAVTLTAKDAVHVRRIGLLVSLVGAYNRAKEEAQAREKRVNAHVGQVGERREFTATYAGENWFDTAYGSMVVARFDTPEGLIVYKGSSPFWPDKINAGDEVKFVGTIKEHGDYKGTAQTIVQRCALAKEKPAKASKKVVSVVKA